MCDLGGWDGAIMISAQALRDLAVALDQSVQPTADTYPPATRNGLTFNCAEQLLNFEMLIPRVLYGTWNTDFDPDGAAYAGADDDLERLHARLNEYGRLTGINILTGQVTGDPGNRLTFVRTPWFDGVNNNPDLVLQPPDAAAGTVRMRLAGKVLIGDNFVDGATVLNSPQALDFTMELDYRVRVGSANFFPFDQLNVGLGSLPFTTLSAPCPSPLMQRLPPLAGRPVWAQNLGTPSQNNPSGSPAGVQWRLTNAGDITSGAATLFTGAPGDTILDPDNPNLERWRVVDAYREPVSFMDPPDNADGLQSLPRRLLVDTTCNGMTAEAGKSFAVLKFDHIFSLSIVGMPVLSMGQRDAINRSLMKLDGFLVGAWLNPLFSQLSGLPPPSPQQLAVLALLGNQAMDVAPLPADLTPPLVPRLIADDGVPYVQSEGIRFEDTATHVFDESTGDAIGLGGKFTDLTPPAGALPEAFNIGQDVAMGISQAVLDRWLEPLLRPNVRAALAANVPGFDAGAFDACAGCLTVRLADNQIRIHLAGEGALDLGLFEVPFDFRIDFPLRFATRPAVLRDGTGQPVDALGAALPADLSCVGLDLANGDFLATTPSSNPLCFLGYVDPRAGGDSTTQPTGSWALVNGGGCGAGFTLAPLVNPAFRWRETDFPVAPFPCPGGICLGALRPGLEVSIVPPAKDEVEVDPDFPWWIDLAVGLFAGPFFGVGPIEGTLATIVLVDLAGFELVSDNLRSGVAGTVPIQPNNTTGWQFFLQHSNPVVGPSNDALTIDPNSLCLLFRVLPRPDARLGNWAAAVCSAAGL
jgi:hypothetical protein